MNKLFLIAAIYAGLLCNAIAQVGMGSMFPGPGTAHSTGGGGISFTGTDAQTANPGFGSGTFTVAIDSASLDRIVVFSLVSNSSSLGTPTVNGGAATLAAGNCATATNVCVYYANVTTGTTATIGYGSGSNAIAVVVGILKGQSGGGTATSSSPVTYTAGGSEASITVTPTDPVGGLCPVAAGFQFAPSGTPVYTWSGTTSSGGDQTTAAAGLATLGLAHSSVTGAIGVSTTGIGGSGLGFGGTMAAACWAP